LITCRWPRSITATPDIKIGHGAQQRSKVRDHRRPAPQHRRHWRSQQRVIDQPIGKSTPVRPNGRSAAVADSDGDIIVPRKEEQDGDEGKDIVKQEAPDPANNTADARRHAKGSTNLPDAPERRDPPSSTSRIKANAGHAPKRIPRSTLRSPLSSRAVAPLEGR